MDIGEEKLTKREKWEIRKAERAEEGKRLARARMVKRTSLWTVGLLAVGLTVFGLTRTSSNPATGGAGLLADALSALDQIKGNKESQVVLVEYSDFQCPACKAYHPVVKQLMEEFGDKIQFVYRHFPLSQHKQARPAAYAAEAAGRQGKFWEMHDLIFDRQNDWANQGDAEKLFLDYASELKLNLDQFGNDLDAAEIKDKVESDFKSGAASSVNHTPTFFLNGKEIPNPQGYEEFKALIAGALAGNL